MIGLMFILGIFIGGFIGIFIMSCLQISKYADSVMYLDENIIAEINGEIYTKEMFAEKLICKNDVVELVKFVGGG